MPSVEHMRNELMNLYASPGWARKVKNMADKQVLAIYMAHLGKSESKPKEESKPPDDDTPF